MFHRIKSDAPEEQGSNEQPKEQEEKQTDSALSVEKPNPQEDAEKITQDSPAQAAPEQPEEKKPEAKEEAAEKAKESSDPKPEPQKEKEAKSMNTPQPAQETTEEQAREQTQAEQAQDQDTNVRPLDIPGGGFQRTGQPGAGRVPGSYAPGAYPASYGTQSASPATGSSESRLLIGGGITMSGEIESCDHLVVEGTVEASLKGASVLDIAESGTFYGTVEIEEATIAGRFEGDLTVKGRLTIRSTGTITGSITYKELEVEAGAVLDGKMTPLKVQQAQPHTEQVKSAKEAAAIAKAQEIKAQREPQPEPANTDEAGLFSEKKAS